MNEAHKLAAWLRANAKHMGSPFEVDQMLRAAVVMKKLADQSKENLDVSKQETSGNSKRVPMSGLWR